MLCVTGQDAHDYAPTQTRTHKAMQRHCAVEQGVTLAGLCVLLLDASLERQCGELSGRGERGPRCFSESLTELLWWGLCLPGSLATTS